MISRKYSQTQKCPGVIKPRHFFLVGTARFELTTSRTPSERATRLRYVPKSRILRLIFRVGFVKPDYFLAVGSFFEHLV